ncbi:MAG TPA: DUF3221 domain-containing protein [Terriglobia bacterium]|nr:DUF3221 domain-containing protein [Terriglobia bacterium]
MKRKGHWAAAATVILAVALPLLAADIRGKVTSVSANTILIEGRVEKDTQVDKASTRVTDKTSIFRMVNGQKTPAAFRDLKVGQTVEATFVGPVAESYPVQATAGEIVILEDR